MSKQLTTDDFKNKMYVQHGNDFEVIGKYINARTKIRVKHKCGFDFMTRPDFISTVSKGYGCPVCSNNYNSIASRLNQKHINLWQTDPDIAMYLKNKEDGYNITSGSNRFLEWVCPRCGHIQTRSVHTVKANGFICEMCTDGFSKPEKFMRSILIQLGIEFEMQKKFEWSGNKKYDFYFEGILCETHGLQHYEHCFRYIGARTLEEEIQNDKYKEMIAKENGFNDDTYIVIDCRKSEKDWIKRSILNSKLSKIYDLSKINWDQCEKDCLSSLILEICNLWNQGYSTTEIKRELHISKKSTIVSKYLKICDSLGLCNYNSKQSRINASVHKVVCLNNKQVFNSIKDAEKYYNIRNVSGCCIGQVKSAGKHPTTKEPLVWRYYEDFIHMTDENICDALYIQNKKSQRIICLNTLQVFNSLADGALYGGLKNSSSISSCLKNKQKTAGKDPKTGEALKWMLYDKYLLSTTQ